MTVDEKRKLELKTMYQIIGSIVIISTIRLRGNFAKIVNRFGNMQSIALMHALIWKRKPSVVFVKLIAMRLHIVKKFVRSCVMGALECYWYHQSKSLDICTLNGKTKKEASDASFFFNGFITFLCNNLTRALCPIQL